MKITFKKAATRRYEALVRRDDRVVLDVPTFDRSGRLPHDIAHLIVESGLCLKHGFWALIAEGLFSRTLVFWRDVRTPGQRSDRANESGKPGNTQRGRVLVSAMLDIAAKGIDGNPQGVSARLSRDWRPRKSQRSPIGHPEVMEVCQRLRAAEREWNALPVGETLTFKWITQRGGKNTRVSRERQMLDSDPVTQWA